MYVYKFAFIEQIVLKIMPNNYKYTLYRMFTYILILIEKRETRWGWITNSYN